MRIALISGECVRDCLSMPDCIEAMVSAMAGVSGKTIAAAPRTIVKLADGSGYLGVMPDSLSEPPVFGAKLVSLCSRNAQGGRAVIQGCIVLFDSRTGAPTALVDAAEITSMRTAATSAVATRLLARSDARTLGLLGYGIQAASHLEAICAVRDIEQVRVWGPSIEKAHRFTERLRSVTKAEIVPVHSAREASACDVVCTVTSAHETIIRNEWVRPGSHVNLVGAHTPDTREADTALMSRARVFVDSIAAASREAGDLLIPIREGAFGASHVAGEIGDLLLQRIEARQSAEQITVFKSVGLACQDLMAAHEAYIRWKSSGSAERRSTFDDQSGLLQQHSRS